MSWNSLRKLPILIFGIIQKPLRIKASKRPGDDSINKTSEHIWQLVTSSSSLVFHNTFVGQLFCKHNSSSFITTIYNYLTLLTTVLGLILNTSCMCYQHTMPFWIFYGSFILQKLQIYMCWRVSSSYYPRFTQIRVRINKKSVSQLYNKDKLQ